MTFKIKYYYYYSEKKLKTHKLSDNEDWVGVSKLLTGSVSYYLLLI